MVSHVYHCSSHRPRSMLPNVIELTESGATCLVIPCHSIWIKYYRYSLSKPVIMFTYLLPKIPRYIHRSLVNYKIIFTNLPGMYLEERTCYWYSGLDIDSSTDQKQVEVPEEAYFVIILVTWQYWRYCWYLHAITNNFSCFYFVLIFINFIQYGTFHLNWRNGTTCLKLTV